MSIKREEQETVVNFLRDDNKAIVYTSDQTVMTKLDKKVNEENSPWKLIDKGILNGNVISKTYITDKKLILFKTKSVERDFSEEEKKRIVERLRQGKMKKNNI